MRLPKYRIRPDRDTAFVEIDGRRVSLPGRANSKESEDAYRRLVSDFLLKRPSKTKPEPIRPRWEITVAEVVDAWLSHCRTYYLSSAHTRSNEYDNCRLAIRPLVVLFGELPMLNLEPADVKQAREAMIAGGWGPPENGIKKPRPWSRSYINSAIGKIKRMCRWGVEHGIVSPDVSASIAAISPLRRGRTAAKERRPVKPVPLDIVEATLPYMPAVVAAMVRIQTLTGMRSDNLCSMQPGRVDRSSEVWVYYPPDHKTSHYDKMLAIVIGPKAQSILSPFLDRPEDQFCFSPREVGKYTLKVNRRRVRGPRYVTNTYRNAVRRAVTKANKIRKLETEKAGKPAPPPLPYWHPHQLRHLRTEQVKQTGGLEAARAYLGHSSVKTTEIYDARDFDLACKIALEIG